MTSVEEETFVYHFKCTGEGSLMVHYIWVITTVTGNEAEFSERGHFGQVTSCRGSSSFQTPQFQHFQSKAYGFYLCRAGLRAFVLGSSRPVGTEYTPACMLQHSGHFPECC